MARVKIEDIVDHLSTEMRRALDSAIREVAPDSEIDRYALYRAFRRGVSRTCSTWENVPDHYVEK